MPLQSIALSPQTWKKAIAQPELQSIITELNTHFEYHDDWVNAAKDMQLTYDEASTLPNTDKPHQPRYASLLVTGGDFYAEVGILMRQFVQTSEGQIVLICEGDDTATPICFLIE